MAGDAPATPEWLNHHPERYDELLEEAVQSTRRRFAEFLPSDVPLNVYASPKSHFRLRVKFMVHGNEGYEYGSDDEGDVGEDASVIQHAGWHAGKMYPVDEYPIAAENICAAMPKVLAFVTQNRPLRNKLRGIQYLTTLSGDLLITLVYKQRSLGDVWQKHAEALRAHMGCDIIAQSKGVERLIGGRNYVDETLTGPDGSPLHYRQIAGNFSNPNGRMAEHTLKWLSICAEEMEGKKRDLLELYCGGGNHTIAMAKCYRKVLGVEINSKLVAAAHQNIMRNKSVNAFVMRAPSERFCSALLRHDTWKVDLPKYAKTSAPDEAVLPGITGFLADQKSALAADSSQLVEDEGKPTAVFDFGAVICDPPRAGLDEVTCALIARYPHIAYISCNPEALLRDLRRLSGTHRVVRMAVFDHFPYCGHLECGAFLKKRHDQPPAAPPSADPPVGEKRKADALQPAEEG
eukprot:TRINITY_DN32293_c0_g1_i1.p2 TRINITY_DN32293_c0_g1~~TRINITY_DN32293_c0_g1_i1.p2  ORF type:complete len:461 (+),score=149.38 TRINITY_DN32293_c0_g1_i1:50-1432(+)